MWTNRRNQAGHSLPESVMAVSLVGIMLVSLFAGFTTGFALLRAARENTRAAEILNEQAERLRLLSWYEVSENNPLLPASFTEPLNPDPATNPDGAIFHGTIEVTPPADWPAAYRDNGRLVTITLTWTNSDGSAPIVHRRQIQTCVARYGMHSSVATP